MQNLKLDYSKILNKKIKKSNKIKQIKIECKKEFDQNYYQSICKKEYTPKMIRCNFEYDENIKQNNSKDKLSSIDFDIIKHIYNDKSIKKMVKKQIKVNIKKENITNDCKVKIKKHIKLECKQVKIKCKIESKPKWSIRKWK